MKSDNALTVAEDVRRSIPITDRPFMFVVPSFSDGQDNHGRFNYPPIGGLVLTRGLRISGLLDALPALDAKNLLYLLSFATPYGIGRPTVQQLAHAMRTSTAKVRSRMDRLTRFSWHGKPLVRPFRRTDGEDAYMLSSDLVWIRECSLTEAGDKLERRKVTDPSKESAATDTSATSLTVTADPTPIGGLVRDRIIEHSRARYTRPRANVEADIARSMGWDRRDGAEPQAAERDSAAAEPKQAIRSGTASPHEVIRRELITVGVTRRVADELLDRYPLDTIRRQLDWLPFRNAKSPARLIVSAIEGNYAEPVALRHHSRSSVQRQRRTNTAHRQDS